MDIIKNILGKPKFKGKGDWDFDGIKDSKDCQPFNPLRQDEQVSVSWNRMDEEERMSTLRFIHPPPPISERVMAKKQWSQLPVGLRAAIMEVDKSFW